MFGHNFVIVAGSVRPGARCKYCGARITWATTSSEKGKPSKTLPFDGRPFPLRSHRNDETGVVFEYWPRGSLHFVTCPKFPPRPHLPRSVAPRRAAVQRRDTEGLP